MTYADVGVKLEVEYFGERYATTVVAESLYDAKMVRLKGQQIRDTYSDRWRLFEIVAPPSMTNVPPVVKSEAGDAK